MTHPLFDKSDETPVVRPIPDGAADIARALGQKPENTWWDYNAVYSAKSGMKFVDDTIGVVNEGVTTLARGGANALTLKLEDGFLDYQQKYVGVGKVLEVTHKRAPHDQFLYPEQSVYVQLAKCAEEDKSLKSAFMGAVICGLLPVADTLETADKLGAKTLINPEQTMRFNSKARIVEEAAEGRYNVAPHTVARNWDDIENKLEELAGKARDLGLDPQEAKYWVKFDNMAGGTGVTAYKPASMSIDDVKDWIATGLYNAGKSPEDFMPVVFDIDIGALPNVNRILGNMNVQAIVANNGVSITGVTFQKTSDNGAYIGGGLPQTPEDKALATEAYGWALPVLKDAQKKGYRGYAGIDVILCEEQDGKKRGYILEMNGRLNSSTSLLSMSHKVARDAKAPDAAACNLSTQFKKPLKDFKSYMAAFNDVIYRANESDFEGVIPIIMKPAKDGGIGAVKTIAVAKTPERLAIVEKKYNNIVQHLPH
ncbi:MAG: hypothetical protein OXT65_07745 [Alphaproteobacteria bacterium]|nr:hypothetical protein [Alphaproteobacteria bacterium]